MADLQTSGHSNQGLLTPVEPEIEKYIRNLESNRDHPVLLEMERTAREKGFPIVDRSVGSFLETLTKIQKPRRIFEFGSGFGYSSYWFARAAGPDAKIFCSDGETSNYKLAKHFLEQFDLWKNIDFRVGYAQDIFRWTEGTFDICFNDADKDQYPEIWRMARERIAPGGLYIADNVLWHGRVVRVPPVDDIAPGWTESIIEHNQLIFDDTRFDSFINPIRDGVLVARKK